MTQVNSPSVPAQPEVSKHLTWDEKMALRRWLCLHVLHAHHGRYASAESAAAALNRAAGASHALDDLLACGAVFRDVNYRWRRVKLAEEVTPSP